MKSLIFLLTVPVLMHAATITTQTTCGFAVSSASSCIVNETTGLNAGFLESALSSASVAYTANGLSISSATASTTNGTPFQSPAESAVTLQVIDTLATSGPLRPGYLVVTENLSALSFDGIAIASLKIAGMSVQCSSAGSICVYSQNGVVNPVPGTGTIMESILLGTDMSLSLEQSSTSGSGAAESARAQTAAGLTVSFFEADGVTPATAVSVVPEPNALTLLVIGCIALAGMARLRLGKNRT